MNWGYEEAKILEKRFKIICQCKRSSVHKDLVE